MATIAQRTAKTILEKLPQLEQLSPASTRAEFLAFQHAMGKRSALRRIVEGLPVVRGWDLLPVELQTILGSPHATIDPLLPADTTAPADETPQETPAPSAPAVTTPLLQAPSMPASSITPIEEVPAREGGDVSRGRRPYEVPAGATVPFSPQIGLLTMKSKGMMGALRRYLHARHLDAQGQGMVTLDDLLEVDAGTSHKQFQRDITAGNGTFWTQDERGRLWLYSPGRIAGILGIDRFRERFVDFPIAHTFDIGMLKAQCFAAWLASHDTPMSRATIHKLTGVSPRTQRHYCRVAGIIRETNYTVGELWKQKKRRQNRAYEQGRGAFKFNDIQGKQGTAGNEYIAWQNPNTHKTTFSQRSRHMRKRHNIKIDNLRIMPSKGTNNDDVMVLFHKSGASASKSRLQHPEADAYYPSQVKSDAGTFWHVLTKKREC